MRTWRLFKTAMRGLIRHPLRTALMTAGIVVGIGALTVILSAGKAAQRKVMAQIDTFGGDAIMVRAGGGSRIGLPRGDVTTLKVADAEAIREQVSGARKTTSIVVLGQVPMRYGNRNTTASVMGASPSFTQTWRWDVSDGMFFTEREMSGLARVCVLGRTVARDLFGEENPVGERILVNNVSLEVIGVLRPKGVSPGGGDMNNRIVVPLTTAMRRLSNTDHLGFIRVQVADPRRMALVVADLRALLRERHRLADGEPDDFSLVTPDWVQQAASRVSGTFTLTLGLISLISLLVGGIVVMNVMLISVNERIGEIGLRMAVGARRRDILVQFLIESSATTLLGGAVGAGVGLVGAQVLTLLTGTPTAVSWEGFAASFGAALLIGLTFGVQPARRASALHPVEALR